MKISLLRWNVKHTQTRGRRLSSSANITNYSKSARCSQGDIQTYTVRHSQGDNNCHSFRDNSDFKMANEKSAKRRKSSTCPRKGDSSEEFSKRMSIGNLEDITFPKYEPVRRDQFELDELQRLTVMSASLSAFIFCVLVFSVYQRVTRGIFI